MANRNLQMLTAVLAAPGQVQFNRVPLPEAGQGTVRIRLEGCGICGSNLPPWEGRAWFKHPFPAGQPGHEGWGWIDAVGPNVSTWKVGERVAGLGYHSFAEFDLVPEENLVRLPACLESKPVPGEALGCAWNVFQRAQIGPGQTVAIVGIGFLGALLTQLAVHAGAQVIAISRRPLALEMAKGFGANAVIPMADRPQVVRQVLDVSGPAGCDCVIEAVGLQEPLDLAAELTRERGRLIIAGYHQDGLRQVNMQLWNWRGLDVVNAHERDPKVYVEGMRAAVQAMADGVLEPWALCTHRVEFPNLASGLNCLRTRPADFLKALVVL
jgi:threonine dehydrogenase-like Zn-dependent dehydrogenase